MKSLEELKAIRDKMQGQVGLRAESEASTRVVVSDFASMNPLLRLFSPVRKKLHILR